MPEPITAVYILTDSANHVLYTGVTSDLEKRIAEHRIGRFPKSFASKYKLYKLVYFEITPNIVSAISREKQIKAGSRAKKLGLVESLNPAWEDLFPGAHNTKLPEQIASSLRFSQ